MSETISKHKNMKFLLTLAVVTSAGRDKFLSENLNEVDLSLVLDHGCNCRLLATKELGPEPIDELDRACQEWTLDELCMRKENGVCSQPGDESEDGDFDENGCGSSINCHNEACRVDFHYLNRIKEILNNEDAVLNLGEHGSCGKELRTSSGNACCGTFPNYNAYDLNEKSCVDGKLE